MELVINGAYKRCVEELRELARTTAHDTGNLFFWMLQILEHMRDYEIISPPLIGDTNITDFCHDHEGACPAVLKSLRPELLPAARDGFLQMGTAWVNLGPHPHIVQCHEKDGQTASAASLRENKQKAPSTEGAIPKKTRLWTPSGD